MTAELVRGQNHPLLRDPPGDPGLGRHADRGRGHARRRAGQGATASSGSPTPARPRCPASRSPGRRPPTTASPSTWTPCRRPCTGSSVLLALPVRRRRPGPASAPSPPPSSPSPASTAPRSPATPSPAWTPSRPSSPWSCTAARAPGRSAPSARGTRAASPSCSPTRACPRPTSSPAASTRRWPRASPARWPRPAAADGRTATAPRRRTAARAQGRPAAPPQQGPGPASRYAAARPPGQAPRPRGTSRTPRPQHGGHRPGRPARRRPPADARSRRPRQLQPPAAAGPPRRRRPRRPRPRPEPGQPAAARRRVTPTGWSMEERLYNQVWGMFEDLARTVAAYRSAVDFADSRMEQELDQVLSDPRSRIGGQGDAAREAARAKHAQLVDQARPALDRDLAQLTAEAEVVEPALPAGVRALGQPRLARLPGADGDPDGPAPGRPPPARERRAAHPDAGPAAAGARSVDRQRPRRLPTARSSTPTSCAASPWTRRSRTRPGCSPSTRPASSPCTSSTRPAPAPPSLAPLVRTGVLAGAARRRGRGRHATSWRGSPSASTWCRWRCAAGAADALPPDLDTGRAAADRQRLPARLRRPRRHPAPLSRGRGPGRRRPPDDGRRPRGRRRLRAVARPAVAFAAAPHPGARRPPRRPVGRARLDVRAADACRRAARCCSRCSARSRRPAAPGTAEARTLHQAS